MDKELKEFMESQKQAIHELSSKMDTHSSAFQELNKRMDIQDHMFHELNKHNIHLEKSINDIKININKILKFVSIDNADFDPHQGNKKLVK